jgi:hypothetical protein
MADDKKKEKPPAPVPFWSHPDKFVEGVLVLVTLLVFIYLLNAFLMMLNSAHPSPLDWLKEIHNFITGKSFAIFIIRLSSTIITAICLVSMYRLIRKIKIIRLNQKKLLYPESSPVATAFSPQWEKILSYVESLNENDWRQSILQADIMLADVLDKLHLPGDSIGEKLKAVERSDFTTLNNAWEAHKVRNQIAHEGAQFVLNQREARRVISLYQTVFEEFKVI